MTNREFFKAIANNNITAEVIAKATEELTKLDARNEKRRNTETENDKANSVIAEGIIKFLTENGTTSSVALAEALNISTNKANGIALKMVAEGILTKSEVKEKDKNGKTVKRTAYSVVKSEDGEGEEVEGE